MVFNSIVHLSNRPLLNYEVCLHKCTKQSLPGLPDHTLFYHNEMKIEINKKENIDSEQTQRLNNTLLNDQWVTKTTEE